jgi:hypothetical protein
MAVILSHLRLQALPLARDIDVVETGESEQYLESYNVIDESTGIITTYNTDGSIMEVFDPNFESEEA